MAQASLKSALRMAIQAGEARDYGRSIELLTRVLAESDEYPEALVYLGRAHHALGEHERAVQALRAYVERGGDPETGLFFLGRSYLALRRNAEALQCFRGSVEAQIAAGKPERAETLAFLGISLLRERRPAKALEILERAVTIAPDDARVFSGYRNALFVNAVRKLARGEADLAAQMLGFVIANGGDGVSPRLYRSRALRSLGRLDEAIEDIGAALESEPNDPALVYQRLVLLLQAGRADEAGAELARLAETFPDFPAVDWDATLLDRYRAFSLLKSGDPRGALQAALDLLRSGAKDVQSRMIAAEACRELGQYERAVNHFTRALELDPKSPDLLLGRADAHRASGDLEAALADVKRAERAGADPGLVLYYGTLCHAGLGADPRELLPRLQKLVRERASDPAVLFALGEALFKTGRPDLSRGWFEKTLIVDEDNEKAFLYLIAVSESVDGPDAIVDAYDRYLERWADNNEVRREYIRFLVDAKDYGRTASVIESGLAYGDPGPKTLKLLAFCQRSSGRWREAAILYRSLLRAEPEDAELLLGLAYCLDKSGARATALELLEKGAAFTGNPVAFLALGRLRAQAGKAEQAIDAFKKAAAKAPGHPEPLEALAALYKRTGPSTLAARYAAEAAALRKTSGARRKTAPPSRETAASKGKAAAPRKRAT